MRTPAVLAVIALASPVAAQPREAQAPRLPQPVTTVGVSGSLAIERTVAPMLALQLGLRAGDYWVDGAVGLGAAAPIDPAGSGFYDGRAYEARLGIGRVGCGNIGCTGLVASAGYHVQWMKFEDGLTDLMAWTEQRDLLFVELRGVARLRLGAHVAVEAALAVRGYQAVHTELTDGGSNAGIVAAVGMHATL